jgi:crotonobetainyl-CoA:carnitine CoA-transferase CaiB-like acyl-CoA transferase
VLGRLDGAANVERLERAGIACARLNSVEELLAHPQLADRGRWREVDTPSGPIRAMLPPAILAGMEPRMDRVPDVGEHTARVLAEIGIDEATLARWQRDGIV